MPFYETRVMTARDRQLVDKLSQYPRYAPLVARLTGKPAPKPAPTPKAAPTTKAAEVEAAPATTPKPQPTKPASPKDA